MTDRSLSFRDIEMKSTHCFIEFDKEGQAKEAMDDMDNQKLEGSRLVIQMKGKPINLIEGNINF